MKTYRLLIALVMFFGSGVALAQSPVSKSQAEKDLEAHEAKIEELLLSKYGIDSGLEGIKIAYEGGQYRRYSMNAESYGWKFVSEPDLAFHTFKATTPTYDNGNKFVFEIEVVYSAYEYGYFGARKSFGKYVYNDVLVSLVDYQGKEISKALLLDKLNNLVQEKPSLLEADGYQFVEVDSVVFSNQEETEILKRPAFYYQIDIYGDAVDVVDGFYETEYEVEKAADIHATYTGGYYLYEGKWKMSTQYFYPGDVEIIEERKTSFVPAYKKLDEISLMDMLGGAQIATTIPATTVRKVNDLKRLILYRYANVDKETFVEGEMLNRLFGTSSGQEALEQMYQFKDVMKQYALDSVSLSFTNMSEKFDGENSKLDLVLYYSVGRNLTSSEVKGYKGKVSKDAYKILKYRAKGYAEMIFTVTLANDEMTITDFDLINHVKYDNGGMTTHPLN